MHLGAAQRGMSELVPGHTQGKMPITSPNDLACEVPNPLPVKLFLPSGKNAAEVTLFLPTASVNEFRTERGVPHLRGSVFTSGQHFGSIVRECYWQDEARISPKGADSVSGRYLVQPRLPLARGEDPCPVGGECRRSTGSPSASVYGEDSKWF